MTCGRCGRPLCPDCVRHGPTGVRCAECLRPAPRARGLATKPQILRGTAAAFATGLAGGALLGLLGWINLLTALVLGFGVGSATFLASQRHRDAPLQGIAGAAALTGIVLAAALSALARTHGAGHELASVILSISYGEFVLPAVAAMAAAVARFLV